MLLGFAIRTSRRDSRNASNSISGRHNRRCNRTARCSCIPRKCENQLYIRDDSISMKQFYENIIMVSGFLMNAYSLFIDMFQSYPEIYEYEKIIQTI